MSASDEITMSPARFVRFPDTRTLVSGLTVCVIVCVPDSCEYWSEPPKVDWIEIVGLVVAVAVEHCQCVSVPGLSRFLPVRHAGKVEQAFLEAVDKEETACLAGRSVEREQALDVQR